MCHFDYSSVVSNSSFQFSCVILITISFVFLLEILRGVGGESIFPFTNFILPVNITLNRTQTEQQNKYFY